jgi:pSer/pThr/pTyr-binding forkhead associated (FHA) protein
MVSRRHCELLADESGVMVRDLGSLHGTYVNGERVDGQRRLENGNVLGLGPIPYEIVITDSMRRTVVERLRHALPSRWARPRHPR